MEAAEMTAIEQRLASALLDSGLLQRLSEKLAAEIFDTLDELLELDVNVVGGACSGLGTIAVFRVLRALCSEVLAPPAEEALPVYSEFLPPSVFRKVTRKLGAFMVAHLPVQATHQDITALAIEMLKATLGEVAPAILEQPLEHAQALARALSRVSVRLYGLYSRQGAFDEHACRRLMTAQHTPFDEYTCMELAVWVFYDIVREMYPRVLKQPVADEIP